LEETVPTPVHFKYHAFLSYAHADVRWGKWLHSQLEGFRIDRDLVGRDTSRGVVPKTLRPIFRDQEDFSGGDSLTDATVSAIDQSAALIVLCSTASATRPAVNEEVRLFRWLHSDRPVIPVIIDGSYPNNFPHALRFEIASDGSITDRPVTILGPDLREEADGRQLGVAKIVAGLIGVEADDIYRRAERARRAANRFRNAVIAVLAVLTVAAAGSAAYAWQQLRTNEAFLDATLAQFTSLVDTAIRSADAYAVPLTVTRAVLENAEGMLTVMTKYGRDAPKIAYRKATMLAAFSDNYRSLGQTRTAKQRLDEAQQIVADLVRTAPSNNDYLFTKARFHGGAGYLLSTLGDVEASAREYRARYDIMTRLASTDPSNVDWQLELALSRISLVDTYSMRGLTATALHGYREGLAVIERLAVASPGNAKLQRQLGIALTNIAFSLWQQGNIEQAQDNIGKALAIDQKLAAAEPNNAGLQRDLAQSQTLMAGIRDILGDRKGALPSAESASAILRRLTTSDPDNAAWRSDLAIADMVVAILRAGTDYSDASLALARSARDSIGKLIESDPGNVYLRQQVGLFDSQLAESLSKSDQLQAALELFQSARLSFQHLGDQDPTSGFNQAMLVLIDGKIGAALTKAGDLGLALKSYRSAVEVAGKLARSDPSNAMFQQAFADGLNNLGTALMADDKADDALETFRTALAARRRLAATDPAKIDWQTDVLNARIRIAEALDKQGKTAEAVETSREILAEGEHLAMKAPDNSSVVMALTWPSARLCAAAVQQNDNASAASECGRTMELQRRLVGLTPNNADYKKLLLGLEEQVPTLQLRAANEAGRYAEALALQEQIAARVEGEETKSAGKPGSKTAVELAGVAGQALLAGEPDKAIAACERSLALQPGDLIAEVNRAHALMYLDRGAEARAVYEAHKADLFPDSKPWPEVVAEDFAELRKAGREHPMMAEIEAALGITGKP
jgi:tetratricopeptide (TPR) repeat protein